MNEPRRAVLYSPALLALAVDLARFPYDPAAARIGHARSRTCGSTVLLSSQIGEHLADVGLKVTACAVGQAAAAIFVRSAAGRTAADCQLSLEEIAGWLKGERALPQWPGFDALAAIRDYPGRHEAIQLPWRAAIDALCKDTAGG